MDVTLFPDAKPAEDLAEQFVWRGVAHDVAEGALREAQLLGEQVELGGGLIEPPHRLIEMPGREPQRLNMPSARRVDPFGVFVPAGQLQQSAA